MVGTAGSDEQQVRQAVEVGGNGGDHAFGPAQSGDPPLDPSVAGHPGA